MVNGPNIRCYFVLHYLLWHVPVVSLCVLQVRLSKMTTDNIDNILQITTVMYLVVVSFFSG